ncbi:MAG: hypothetical protein CMM44_01905 [Rhodospirillaceae bacterium]|nr:hypothetical protein [Rhodospirillaceae bacterium]
MSAEKIKIEFEINSDSRDFLENVQGQYNLPDLSKTMRCLLDFAQTDGNLDQIFKQIRCNRCG